MKGSLGQVRHGMKGTRHTMTDRSYLSYHDRRERLMYPSDLGSGYIMLTWYRMGPNAPHRPLEPSGFQSSQTWTISNISSGLPFVVGRDAFIGHKLKQI